MKLSRPAGSVLVSGPIMDAVPTTSPEYTPRSPGLTDQQRQAVVTRDVSVLLSSGAGCGKTHVLTRMSAVVAKEERERDTVARERVPPVREPHGARRIEAGPAQEEELHGLARAADRIDPA